MGLKSRKYTVGAASTVLDSDFCIGMCYGLSDLMISGLI